MLCDARHCAIVSGMHRTASSDSGTDSTVPLAYSVGAAAKLIGLSERRTWDRVGTGEIESYMDGGRRLISRRALEDYVAKLEAASVTAA